MEPAKTVPVSGFATFPKTPEKRTYVHVGRCGGGTQVDGWILKALCNPYRFVSTTECAKCQSGVPLRHVAWADTGETISDYRKRMKTLFPASLKAKKQLIGTALAFGGIALGILISVPFWSTRTLVPPVLGFFIGATVGIALAMRFGRLPPVDYRQFR